MRTAVVALAVSVSVVVAVGAVAEAPPGQTRDASDYQFGADMGLLVFHVHRERAADFEAVMTRLGQALQASAAPGRREQAAGWRFFRGREEMDAIVYVLVLEPVVRGADYDPVKMFTEFMPAEAPDLYERLKGAVVRVERLDLERLP
ncbi:MAG: hypothetical protein ABS36_05730 [Acidobacteria bacterium SCN 69-37]|nr:MAG: hypothetical protein ABS36_05730 [Acidobacteria bacterium SCN 69-37]